MPIYQTKIKLRYYFTDTNAKLATAYCNGDAELQTIMLNNLKANHNLAIKSYHWSFEDNYAYVIVTTHDLLNAKALTALTEFTKHEISDGIGESFSFQSFASFTSNQAVNQNMTTDEYDEPVDYIDLDGIDNEFKFELINQ